LQIVLNLQPVSVLCFLQTISDLERRLQLHWSPFGGPRLWWV